jgi:tetratricopeptide (TPR) repeat protein
LTERFDALEQAGPRHTPEDAGLSGKTEETIEKPIEMTIEKPTEQAEVPKENPKQATTPGVVASAENADDASSGAIVERVRDYGIDDARYYRQRGIEAYRSGDIAIALTDFDLAIKFDPAFSDAYVDRGIVFYRMGDVKSALADVAQAKRIDDVKQSHASMLGPQ